MKALVVFLVVALIIAEVTLPGGVKPQIQRVLASVENTTSQLNYDGQPTLSRINLSQLVDSLVSRVGALRSINSYSNSSGRTQNVRITHYWPPLGGVNCFDFRNGQCMSRVSGCNHAGWPGSDKFCSVGNNWNRLSEMGAAACPPGWPFGTRFTALGRTWTCVDRGGAIVGNHVDLLLQNHPGVDYETIEFVR